MLKPIEQNNTPATRPQLNTQGSLFTGDKGLLLVAVLLVFVVFMSWGAVSRIEKQVRSDIQETLQNVLDTTHKIADRWFEERIDNSLLVVERPDVKRLVKELLTLAREKEMLAESQSLKQLREIIKPILEKNDDLGFFVIARDGINVASMRDSNLGQLNFFSQYHDYFENLLKGESQLVLPLRSDVALPGVTGELLEGEPTMFVGVPIKDDGGVVIAAFTIRLDPSYEFSRIVQMARIGLTGDSYAFDKDGMLISESRFDDQLREIGLIKQHKRAILNLKILDPGGNLLEGFQPTTPRENLPLTLMAQKATDGESGINLDGYRNYGGVLVVGAWFWHGKYKFGQAFEIDIAEAYKSYFAIRRTVIGLLVVIVTVSFGFAVGLLRRKRLAEMLNIQLAREVEERNRSEEKFRVLTESSPDGMLFSNKVGEIIMLNRQIEKIFGYSSKELLGKKIEILIPGRFAGGHPKHRDSFFKNPHVRPMGQGMDLWGIRKDGQEFPLEIALSPVETGGEIAVIASVRDITERRKIEEKLSKDAERTTLLLELYFRAPELSDTELYNYVLDKAVALTDSSIGFFHQVVEDQKTVVLLTWNSEALKGCEAAHDAHYPLGEAGNWVDCIRQGEPVIYNDFPSSPNQKGLPDGHTPLHRFMSIPVITGGTIRYIFGVGNKKEEYGQDDVVQIQLIANELSKIMKQRKTEEEVREKEAGLSEAQRIAQVGSWELDIEQQRITWSDEVYRIFGLGYREFEGTYDAFLEIIHPDDREMVNRAYSDSLISKTPYGIIHRLQLKDGAIKYVSERCETYYDNNGEPIRSAGTVQDITEQVKAEEELANYRERLEELVKDRTLELQENEEKLLSITSSAQAAIVMISNEGDVSFWNEAAERIFGWKAAEVRGKNLHSVIVPERYMEDHVKAFQNFQATGRGKYVGKVVELDAKKKNGEEFVVELALSSVKIKGKWNAIGLISDISERKKSDEELRKNMDELERFSKMAIGREQQMISLKVEINSLLMALGKEEKYKITK